MRDDIHSAGDSGAVANSRWLGEKVRDIPWRNALSIKWWGRWFRSSMMQSGRLTTILVLLGLLFVRIDDPVGLQIIRARTFDFYQVLKPRETPPNSPVVIIDIDQKSINELGQFPWPRTTVADLVTNATALGVNVLGFDVVFSEPDQTSVAKIAESVPPGLIEEEIRERLKSVPTNDAILADAIKKSGKVVLGQTTVPDKLSYQGIPPRTSFAVVGDDPKPYLARGASVLRPLPELDQAAAGRGVFALSDRSLDGIVRQVPMIVTNEDTLYPSLTLEMLRVNLRGRTIGISTDASLGGVSQIFIRPPRSRDSYVVKTDAFGEVRPYFRSSQTWRAQHYISATDVIHNRLPPDALKGKLALVGMSATGLLADLRASPLNSVMPGVEAHANILENILFDSQLKYLNTALAVELLTALAIGLIMIIITPMVSIASGFAVFALIAGGYGWWSWNAFATRLELYDPTFPIASAFLFYAFLAFAGYMRTEAQRKQVRSAFGQYLSPDLVKRLAEDPSKLTLGGENREMTFMFSDIRGFTSISELFDAQGLTRLINRLLTPLTNVILSTNGTIDKYMGDCVMAFWNAPLDVKDHAPSACKAALGMVQAVKDVNKVLEAEAKQEGREHRVLNVGIGINSGIACVGNMGSEQRFDYSVLGDSVNLASRLEGQSKSYGVTVVVGEKSAELSPMYPLLELDLIMVKGKKQAVRIFTLIGDPAMKNQGWFAQLAREHDAALAAYRAQQWDEAERRMQAARAIVKTQSGLVSEMLGFYDVMEERIAGFRMNPPGADWDGVFVATSK
ncbi:MAG: CHASE2 domain-containing protein [Rhodospirillaceae bacterium]